MQEQASGFFCFFLLSQLSEPGRLGTALSGPASRCASAMTRSPPAAVIPRRRSTAVHFQSVERRVQRNLEGLANVRLDPDELPGCRAATLTFFLFFLNAYAEERTRREGRQKSPLASQ